MTLSQLYPFILRTDPLSTVGTVMKDLKRRYRRLWKYDRRSSGDARYAFCGCLPRFPVISLCVVEYEDCLLVDGNDLALLLQHLLRKVDGSNVEVIFLDNPGLVCHGNLHFGVRDWRGTKDDATATGEWLAWCFDFLTLADLRELIAEVKTIAC